MPDIKEKVFQAVEGGAGRMGQLIVAVDPDGIYMVSELQTVLDELVAEGRLEFDGNMRRYAVKA